MWEAIVGKLLGGFGENVVEYYKAKQTLKHERRLEVLRGKVLYEQAKSERAAKSEGYDADWEIAQIKNSGWKDEFTLIVLSIPMIGVFIPGLEGYMAAGFENLAETPDWYRWLIVMIYAATWGIRIWRRKSDIS